MIYSFSDNYFVAHILIRFSAFCLKISCVLSVKIIAPVLLKIDSV